MLFIAFRATEDLGIALGVVLDFSVFLAEETVDWKRAAPPGACLEAYVRGVVAMVF